MNTTTTVTRILAWCGIETYAEIPAEKKEWYLRRGAEIHEYTRKIDAGEIELSSVTSEFKAYIEAWVEIREKYGISVLQNEKKYFSPDAKYSGTVDRVFFSEVLNGKYVADLKTSSARAITRLQLAAYWELIGDMSLKRCAVILKPQKATIEIYDDDGLDYCAWCGAKKLYFHFGNTETLSADDWHDIHSLIYWRQKHYKKRRKA